MNQDTYNKASVVSVYSELKIQSPAECRFFEALKSHLPHFRVLDLGIGGGRTTRFLGPVAKSYVGIDYSPAFVSSAKSAHPEHDIRLGDARHLEFRDSEFDLVNFSFNGMDYVDLDGRKKIFSEVHRVLRVNGIFYFSTHNKSHPTFNRAPWRDGPFLLRLKNLIRFFPWSYRKRRNRKAEVFLDTYAIINDNAHNYSLMTFYTTPAFLREQLEESGFRNCRLYNMKGEEVSDSQLGEWIYASASKL